MKKLIVWTGIYCASWALLYATFALNIDGAMNVLKFFVWGIALLSPLLLLDIAMDSAAKQAPTPVRWLLQRLMDWITLLLLAWFGHLVTAGAWAIKMLCVRMHQDGVEKRRTQQGKP